MEDNLDTTNVDGAVFDVSLSDSDLLDLIKKPLVESEKHWEEKLGEARRDAMNLWLPNHYKGQDFYDYQEGYLYQDNRIFTSVETVVSVVNARIPQPEVTPAQDTISSMQIAKDLSKVLFAHSEKHQTSDLFRLAARNLILKKAGFIKLR